MSDYEEPSELFEKPRGERRWLGKEHHRGKERLFNSVKDRTFIEKTLSSAEPMSKRSTDKLKASVNDGLEPNVVYSLDKKNRWRDANTVILLGTAPGDVNAEVVQKNGLEQFGISNPNKSTFSVDTRVMYKNDAPGEFGIRRATSSGKGQDYSNFLPKTRELSKKANARVEEQEQQEQLPTVSYNIYKTHRSLDVVGGQMFKAKVVGKSGRHRANKKVDMEVYEYFSDLDDDEEDDEVEEFSRRTGAVLDLTDYVVEPRGKQEHKRKDSEMSYEIIDHELTEHRYTDLLDLHSYLRDQGHTFEKADVTFHNQKENMHHQLQELQHKKGLRVIDLRPDKFLVDASKWCQLDDGSIDGQMTTVVVFTQLEKNKYNVVVNSNIQNHPLKQGSEWLISLISTASSIREAVSRITTDLRTARKVIDTMKLSSAFYKQKFDPETLYDSQEWDTQLLEMSWPNRHYHASWANSLELSSIGSVLEWKELCEMVKKEDQMGRTRYPTSEDVCGICSRQKRSHELYLTTDEFKIKCSECLREQFYKKLSARRIPIDLKIDVADEFEYLPTFLPLPIINLYVRMVSEKIYKDAGASGSFEKCPSCKSALYFEEPTGQNQSCPCGYTWCKRCNSVPHWPMKCEEYAEWEQKWSLRYAMIHAQGTGTETLMQVTCSCKKRIFHALLPEKFIECPTAHCIAVEMETLGLVYRHVYYPYHPIVRERQEKRSYRYVENCYWGWFEPVKLVYTKIASIPLIRKSVMDVCEAARDVRYDESTHNRAVHREQTLILKGFLEKHAVENAMGTVVYLAETVTAWMHVTSRNDRNIMKTLKRMLENRKKLVEVFETEDGKAIRECLATIRSDIDSVVATVEMMMKCLGST